MKQYEILAFKTTNYKKIWNRISNDLYSIKSVSFTLKECLEGTYSLEDKYLEIYKIVRLSDNQIFSIGDKIISKVWNYYNFDHKPLTIEAIDIIDNTLRFKLSNNTSILLKNTKNIAYKGFIKPLFTTEDGVDVFNDIPVYCLLKSDLSPWRNLEPWFKTDGIHEGWLYFSTKEKAQEYIDLNKPKLSINDVLEIVNLSTNEINQLIDIINSKK